jgi:hypothetical protein
MAEGILAVYEAIIVDEILVARVVRGINVDEVNLARVGVVEYRKSVVVVTFNKQVGRI